MSALNGEVIVADQRIGKSLQLRVFGDEFYARKETLDGYSVLYDTQKHCYCYAQLLNGQYISSSVPTHKSAPPHCPKHLTENQSVIEKKFQQRFAQLNTAASLATAPAGAAQINRTLGHEGGLLSGRTLNKGDVKGLTVLINFQDKQSNILAADVDAMFNADNYNQNGNYCSVKEYFQIISSGKLNYTNLIVGPITLSKRRSHYINNSLVKEAMDIVVNELHVDLTQFDSKGEGIVDAINFLYAGSSQYDGDLWPHNHYVDLQYNNMSTHYYQLTGYGTNTVDLRIGTICHENGHLLCRFPDMYDYGNRDGDSTKSQGIGRYCLMGSGNALNRQRTPAPICGYLRELAGWIDEVVDLNIDGAYNAIHGQYQQLLKYSTAKANEYFVIENRSSRGLDAHIPSSGLAIYHCDIFGSNELQGGTRNRHYQCAVLQADGHLDLENNRNAGDNGDLFSDIAGVVINNTSTPSSRQWDGADSGLQIHNLSGTGESMGFTVGVIANALNFSSSPETLIPDDDPAGSQDIINVAQSGLIASIEVSVEIIHSWISDLKVELIAPHGDTVMLHNHQGHDTDDINKTWHSKDFAELQLFLEQSITGSWQLKVTDTASKDAGRLVSWSLAFSLAPAKTQVIKQQIKPLLAIPDNHNNGIESRLQIRASGNLKDLQLSIDIEHSYIGDLILELVAPTGRTIILHNRTGGDSNNLKRSYDMHSKVHLDRLLDEPIAGEWKLRVYDLAPQDHGILNAWGMVLSY